MYRLVQESGHLASLHWLSLVFVPCLLLFYTRAVYAVVLCLSVCLSVTAVVLSKRWIDQSGFGVRRLSSTHLTLR